MKNELELQNLCPVCENERKFMFKQMVLHKHEVSYFFCSSCGLLQTEKPYWLDEAYKDAIADADTGLVSRNISISKKLSNVLFFFFNKNGKYLDYAGGNGILTRLMRDIGFDFYRSDPYCENILAKKFDASNGDISYEAVTAFEVLEHVIDPVEFLKNTLKQAKTSTIIFSTELFSGKPPSLNEWYYYMPETGQHVSFCQKKTLEIIANKLSLKLLSIGSFHMMTNEKNAYLELTWGLLTGKFSRLLGFFYTKINEEEVKNLRRSCSNPD